PLFVQRPLVEPELFASLRPVAYTGSLEGRDGVMLSDMDKAEEFRRESGRAARLPAPGRSGAKKGRGGPGRGLAGAPPAPPRYPPPPMRATPSRPGSGSRIASTWARAAWGLLRRRVVLGTTSSTRWTAW